MATVISFKPKQVTKRIISHLPNRAHDVVVHRFGLNDQSERKTLEAIGKKYGITRERVRQIENSALNAIRKAQAYLEEQAIFEELKKIMMEMGGLVAEEEFLSHVSPDPSVQNHIHFYLVLGDDFIKHKEDDHFTDRWTVDTDLAEKIHNSLKKLHQSIHEDDIFPESKILHNFLNQLEGLTSEYKREELARRWLSISKMVGKNPLGEWGLISSPNIRARGIRDYSYLMMRHHGSPMHFREVAKSISETFGRKIHTVTCHNELIKDKRFVLVGRGIYALAEWGYKGGVVRDVIRDILKEGGPLSKDDVIDRVMKERYLKKNTILVNLQNKKHFKKTKDGLYTLA